MCFKNPSTVKAKVAKEDITVYKRINKTGEGWIYNPKDENGKKCKWKKGKTYIEKKFPKRRYNKETEFGGGGFHCFSKMEGKKWDFVSDCTYDKTVIMIIPQGAFYYTNDQNEIFCSALKYVEDYKEKSI